MTKSSANNLAELRKMSTPIPINSNANNWQLRNPHQFDDSTPYESGMMDQCVSQNSVSPSSAASHSLSPATALAYNQQQQHQQQQQQLQAQQSQLMQGGFLQKASGQPNIVIGNNLGQQQQQQQQQLGSSSVYQQQNNDSSSNLSAYSQADYLGNLETSSSSASTNANMQLSVDLESLLVNATLSESSSCDPINENEDSNSAATHQGGLGNMGQVMSGPSHQSRMGGVAAAASSSNDANDEGANMNSMNPSFLFKSQHQRQLNSRSPHSPSSSSDLNNNNSSSTNNNNNQQYFTPANKKYAQSPSAQASFGQQQQQFMGSPRSQQNKQRINYKIDEEQLDETNDTNLQQQFKFSNYDQPSQIIQIPSNNNASSYYHQQQPSMSLPTESILTNLYHPGKTGVEAGAAANLLFNPHHQHHQQKVRMNFEQQQQQQRSASHTVLNHHHQQPSLGSQSSQHQRSDPVLTQLALNNAAAATSQQQQQQQQRQQHLHTFGQQQQQQQFFVNAMPIQNTNMFNANTFVNNPIDYQQQQQQQHMVSMSLPSNYSSFMSMDFIDYKNANIINEEDASNKLNVLNGSSNDSGIASSYNSAAGGKSVTDFAQVQIKKEVIDEQYDDNKSLNHPVATTIDDNDERFSKLQLSSPIQAPSINDLDDMNAALFDVGEPIDLNAASFDDAQENQLLIDSFGGASMIEDGGAVLMGRDVGLQQNMMIKVEDEDGDEEDEDEDDDFDDEDDEDDDDDDELDDYEDEDEYGHHHQGEDEHFAFDASEDFGVNIRTGAKQQQQQQPLMVGSVGSSLTSAFMRRNMALSANNQSRKHARIANTDADVHANMKAHHAHLPPQQQPSHLASQHHLLTSNSNDIFANLHFQPFNSQQQQPVAAPQNSFIQQQQQQHLQTANYGYLSSSLPANPSVLDSKMFMVNSGGGGNNFVPYQQQSMIPANAPFQFQPQVAAAPPSFALSSQNNPINHPNLHKLLNNNTTSNNITLPAINAASKASSANAFDTGMTSNQAKPKAASRARPVKQPQQIQKAPQRKRQQKKQDLFDDDDEDENEDSNDGSGDLSDDENNSNEKYADSDSERHAGAGAGAGAGGGLSSSVNSEMLFDLMMSTKNRDSYFWQYNIQSKGPKTRKVLTLRNKDPHLHREFFDPVYQLQTLNSRQGTAVNKLRKGDGNDVTPNPEKLYNLGNQIRDFIQKSYQMNSAIFQPAAGQLASSPSFNQLSTTPNADGSAVVGGVRVNLKREKNKIASRACRLKKKAQHEANKLKLSGLNDEHKQLIDCINQARDLIKTRLKEPHKIPQDKKMIDMMDEMIKQKLKTRVAGHSDAYVHSLMLNVERERSKTGHGGLFDLNPPAPPPAPANRFSANLQFSGSSNAIEEL